MIGLNFCSLGRWLISSPSPLRDALCRARIVAISSALFALSASQWAVADTIIGDVLCYTPKFGSLEFVFGYESFEASPVLLLPGPNNFFTPGPGNLGQLTTFYPGYYREAFRISFDMFDRTVTPPLPIDSFSWVLQNKQYLISTRSPLCPTPSTAPLIASLLVTAGANQVAATGSAFSQAISIRATSGGRALAGLVVRFSAPPTGASATFATSGNATTDVNGVATMNAAAGATAGSYDVTVSVGTSPSPITSIVLPLTNQ
jgi:hypothetical protein